MAGASHGGWVLQAQLDAVFPLLGLLLLSCGTGAVLRLLSLSIILLILTVNILVRQIFGLVKLEVLIDCTIGSGPGVLAHFLEVVVGRKRRICPTRPLARPVVIGLASLSILLVSIHPV